MRVEGLEHLVWPVGVIVLGVFFLVWLMDEEGDVTPIVFNWFKFWFIGD